MTTNGTAARTAPGGTAEPGAMAAIVQHAYGPEPEEVLRHGSVPVPVPRAGQVLVRVRASSVDRGTWHVMAGIPYPVRLAGFGVRRPKARNPGRNLAGEVVAVGPQVDGLAPGDEVYGTAPGALAEHVCARPEHLARRPANLSWEEAAAVPVSGLTALQAVRDHGRVRAGEQVLVLGASGGVGSFTVQLAKAAGAEVTGVCTTSKVDLVAALGADHVVDHTREDATAVDGRYDVILDTGGNRRLRDLRRALVPHGRLVIIGGETGGRWLGGTDRQLRAVVLSRFVGQQLGTFVSSENADDLAELAGLLEAGTIRPAVDRVYPLAETAAALRHLLDGRARGKVVVAT